MRIADFGIVYEYEDLMAKNEAKHENDLVLFIKWRF